MNNINQFDSKQFNFLFDQGRFEDLINLRQSLGPDVLISASIVKLELISLLTIGQERKALKLFKKYKSQLELGSDFIEIFKRYVRREELSVQVDQVILSNREVLEVSFSKKPVSWYISQISNYQNIVLISNSSTLSFSDEEKALLQESIQASFCLPQYWESFNI